KSHRRHRDKKPHRLSRQQSRHTFFPVGLLRRALPGTSDLSETRNCARRVSTESAKSAFRSADAFVGSKADRRSGAARRQRSGGAAAKSPQLHPPSQRLPLRKNARETGRLSRSQANAQLSSRQTRTRQTQIRHFPRLLPARVFTRVSSRASSSGRLLRQGFDAQGAFSTKLSAHLQTPARSGSELLRGDGVEKGGLR